MNHDTPEAIAITDKAALELMEVEKLKAINSELLEALQGYYGLHSYQHEAYTAEAQEVGRKAKAAIAKATGEQA